MKTTLLKNISLLGQINIVPIYYLSIYPSIWRENKSSHVRKKTSMLKCTIGQELQINLKFHSIILML